MLVRNEEYKCGGYYRLSKEDLEKYGSDESSSIQSQRMVVTGFANYNKFNLVKEYVDDGYSGGNFNRPSFKEMLEDIEKGKINCVITKDLSRFGREMYETGKFIEDYFISKGVRYIAINDSYDSLVGDSMIGIRLGINDLYIRDVSRKVKQSLSQKQKRGEYIGNFPKYGYKKDPNDHHHLIIDEEAAKNVRYIYKLALEGFGMNSICKKLTELKLPIPIVYKKEKRGLCVTENNGCGVWKHSTVKDILTSEMYIGNMVQHTAEKISHLSKRSHVLNKKDFYIVQNTHEPIISKEDFEKVQAIINNRSTIDEKKVYHKHLLAGLLICGNCNHNLGITERKCKKEITRYTHCNHYLRKGIHSNCTPNRINYNDLEKDIINYLKQIGEIIIKKYNVNKLVDQSISNYDDELNELEEKITKLNNEIDKNIKIISNLYEDRVAGNITVDIYQTLSKEYNDKIIKLKEEKSSLENKQNQYSNVDYQNNLTRLKDIIIEFMSLKTINKRIIRALIDRIVVYDDKVKENKLVKVFFKFKELEEASSLIKTF